MSCEVFRRTTATQPAAGIPSATVERWLNWGLRRLASLISPTAVKWVTMGASSSGSLSAAGFVHCEARTRKSFCALNSSSTSLAWFGRVRRQVSRGSTSQAAREMARADASTDLLLDDAADGLARPQVGTEVLVLPFAKGGDRRAVLDGCCRAATGGGSGSNSNRGGSSSGLRRGDLSADRLSDGRRRLLERARRRAGGPAARLASRLSQTGYQVSRECARSDGEVLKPRRRCLEALDDGREVEAWRSGTELISRQTLGRRKIKPVPAAHPEIRMP
jgi:hypothetical protein